MCNALLLKQVYLWAFCSPSGIEPIICVPLDRTHDHYTKSGESFQFIYWADTTALSSIHNLDRWLVRGRSFCQQMLLLTMWRYLMLLVFLIISISIRWVPAEVRTCIVIQPPPQNSCWWYHHNRIVIIYIYDIENICRKVNLWRVKQISPMCSFSFVNPNTVELARFADTRTS